jgi:hypothetical protein
MECAAYTTLVSRDYFTTSSIMEAERTMAAGEPPVNSNDVLHPLWMVVERKRGAMMNNASPRSDKGDVRREVTKDAIGRSYPSKQALGM